MSLASASKSPGGRLFSEWGSRRIDCNCVVRANKIIVVNLFVRTLEIDEKLISTQLAVVVTTSESDPVPGNRRQRCVTAETRWLYQTIIWAPNETGDHFSDHTDLASLAFCKYNQTKMYNIMLFRSFRKSISAHELREIRVSPWKLFDIFLVSNGLAINTSEPVCTI